MHILEKTGTGLQVKEQCESEGHCREAEGGGSTHRDTCARAGNGEFVLKQKGNERVSE